MDKLDVRWDINIAECNFSDGWNNVFEEDNFIWGSPDFISFNDFKECDKFTICIDINKAQEFLMLSMNGIDIVH